MGGKSSKPKPPPNPIFATWHRQRKEIAELNARIAATNGEIISVRNSISSLRRQLATIR